MAHAAFAPLLVPTQLCTGAVRSTVPGDVLTVVPPARWPIAGESSCAARSAPVEVGPINAVIACRSTAV